MNTCLPSDYIRVREHFLNPKCSYNLLGEKEIIEHTLEYLLCARYGSIYFSWIMFVYLTIISRIEIIVLILQVLVPGSYYSTLGKPPAFSSSGYETHSKSERKNCLFLQKGILEEPGQKICRAWIQVTSRSFLLTVSLLLSPLDHRIWNPRIQFCKYRSPAWFIASPIGGSIDPRLFIWPSLGSCCSNWGCSHDPTVDITYH